MNSFPTHLVDGYREFTTGRYATEGERYRRLAEQGQSPQTLVIACCDSRTTPELVFNASAGDIFVVRNIAGLVPRYQPDGNLHEIGAALEFAVEALKVENIVVMGHARCGGIKAALAAAGEPLSPDDFIGRWMRPLEPLAGRVRTDSAVAEGDRQTALERISIRHSIANLRTFPNIKALEAAGKLALHGAWFDISAGELWTMDGESGDFARLEI